MRRNLSQGLSFTPLPGYRPAMHTTMFFRQQEQGLQIFVQGWELYQKIIAHNYMNHGEVIATLRIIAGEQAGGDPKILEVGCGDAFVVSRTFAESARLNYTGVDMSEHALEYARKNLMQPNRAIDLRIGNMFDVVEQLKGKFDLILAGYSLHHFGADRKAILLKRFKPLLKPGGVLIVYDIFTPDGEARAEYLERILTHCRAAWSEMDASQMESIHEHVRNNDYPESIGSMERLAKEAGYGSFDCRYRDADEFYGVTTMTV